MVQTMKKIIIAAIILSMSFSLFACGKGKSNAQEKTTTERVTKEEPTTERVTKEEPTTKEPESPEYIGNRSVDYDSTNKWHRVFWSFSYEEEGPYVKADAIIHIRITNDNGEEVYKKSIDVDESFYSQWTNKSWDSSRLLGCIYIEDKDIVPGTADDGTLSISAELADGSSWKEYEMGIYDLPMIGFTLNKPSLPCKINEIDYNGNIEYTVEVMELTAEYSSTGSVKIKLKAKMVYNENGAGSSDYAYVGYKVKDSEGIVVDSGSFSVGPMAVGDIIIEENYLGGKYKLGEAYSIELIDTK